MFCCMLHAKHSQHALSPPARVVSVSHFRYMQKHMHGTHVRVVSAFAPCVTYMKSWTTNTSVTISLSLYTLTETDELVGKLGGRGCCKASIFETPSASEKHSTPKRSTTKSYWIRKRRLPRVWQNTAVGPVFSGDSDCWNNASEIGPLSS